MHKAAKQAFDELRVRKIPKVKEPSAEYARVLAEKKLAYAEYRTIKEEAQELMIAIMNNDSLYEAVKTEEPRVRQREKMH